MQMTTAFAPSQADFEDLWFDLGGALLTFGSREEATIEKVAAEDDEDEDLASDDESEDEDSEEDEDSDDEEEDDEDEDDQEDAA